MIEYLKNLRKKNGRIKNAFITHFGLKVEKKDTNCIA